MNFFTKAAALCLAAVLIFSAVPIFAFAEETDSSNSAEPAAQVSEAGEENKEPVDKLINRLVCEPCVNFVEP